MEHRNYHLFPYVNIYKINLLIIQIKLCKEVITIKEYLFSVDKFEKPKELKGKDAICVLLIRLLLLTPGTIQSHPDMGIGIVTRWRYSDMDDIPNLKLEISKQISMYLPQFQTVNIELIPNETEKELIIKLTVDNTLYVFQTDSNNNIIRLIELQGGI